MISSRLTLSALVFAVIGAASLAFAATAHQAAPTTPAAAAKQARVVQLERVVVIGKRLPRAAL
jgi:Flp pilus assembly protein CpaB